MIALYRAAGFDLIVVETAGIGQSDTEIVDLADLSLYVMTAEYGAASQLEKIDMLDFADMIVLNKFEKRGAEDALRDVRKQWRRNHPDRMKLPDDAGAGVSDHRQPLQRSGRESPVPRAVRRAGRRSGRARPLDAARRRGAGREPAEFVTRDPLVPAARARYLAEIAARGREARKTADAQADAARRAHGLYLSLQALGDPALPDAACRRLAAVTGRQPRARRAARRLQPRARRRRRRKRSPRFAPGRHASRA